MAARISCPRALEEGQSEEVVVRFRKSLRTRCAEVRTRCAEVRTCCGQLLVGCRAFCLVLGVVILMLFLFTYAYAWIPIIMQHCHREPGIELESFNILGMAPSSSSAPGSPLQVNSAFNATFSTWNTNTVTKCFTTYRRMDVRVEYRGQVLLQQQIPLEFSLKPRASRPFSIEMKGSHGQLMNPDLGPVMQAELQSGDITLDFFYNTRYLIADRRSRWESIGCVLVALLDPVGTMVPQDCFTFD